ncbi:hypothetical protein [Endozoicomonas sp.]|uniref:hypothetical protein n=1 Tax=Endozoicomonas sp. TaxID=1892382 RepID=UPI003AF7AC20
MKLRNLIFCSLFLYNAVAFADLSEVHQGSLNKGSGVLSKEYTLIKDVLSEKDKNEISEVMSKLLLSFRSGNYLEVPSFFSNEGLILFKEMIVDSYEDEEFKSFLKGITLSDLENMPADELTRLVFTQLMSELGVTPTDQPAFELQVKSIKVLNDQAVEVKFNTQDTGDVEQDDESDTMVLVKVSGEWKALGSYLQKFFVMGMIVLELTDDEGSSDPSATAFPGKSLLPIPGKNE